MGALEFVKWGIGVFAGVFGVWLGYRLGIKSHVRETRHDLLREQMRDFYSPLLGLKAKISRATMRSYEPINPDVISLDRFGDEVWPLYRQLADQFTANLWLASRETRPLHDHVRKVIDSWSYRFEANMIDDRYMNEVAAEIEKDLEPFFQHLASELERLHSMLIPAA